ncbi:MAG: hypothetical protein JWS11_2040 [Cypionkella sp.]|nr:hypothetical protein [Cypionkella sp.]
MQTAEEIGRAALMTIRNLSAQSLSVRAKDFDVTLTCH